MPIKLYTIKPDRILNMSPDDLMKQIKVVLQQESEQQRRMYKQATRTWKHKPTLNRRSGSTGNAVFSEIEASGRIFAFVELGTNVRYMHMSRNFSPKSTPGSLRARQGSGGAVRLSWPRPGIEARDFTGTIIKKRAPIVIAKLNAVIHAYIRGLT